MDRLCVLLLIWSIAWMGCGEDSTPDGPVEPVDAPQSGAVSGTVTDASTGVPIPGATVTLLDKTVETGQDGRYVFTGVDYADTLNLTIRAIDYEPQTQTVAFSTEHLVLNVPLTPSTHPDAEIRQFLDRFSGLIESLDINNLGVIQEHFSETYLAADDPVTRFGLATGVIPANFERVVASMTALFEEYDAIQFQFRDIQVEVTHSRKASARLNLDVTTETGPRPDRTEITAECQIDFRKEGTAWKIAFWQLFQVDVHL